MFVKTIRNLSALVLIIFSLALWASAELSPEPQHPKSTALVAELVKNYHYSRPELDDKLSSVILNRYIELLDPNKHFFLSSDIQSFEKFRYRLDDAFRDADASPAFEIYNVFRKRVEQREMPRIENLDALRRPDPSSESGP